MEELTKEQRQIIEEEIKKEIKKANTFLKPESINKIIQDIIGDIKGKINNKFKCPKNLEEILSSIPQKVYVSLGKEEIKQILNLDFCCFFDNVFYIDFAPKIEPYEHNQNKTAIEEQRIIQCSYDDLLYLFKTYPLMFNHCIFDYKIDNKTPIEQIKKLSFLNCNFKKEIYLNFQECLDIFQMDNCVFEDRVTIKGKFKDNVYFNNSIFKNYANFHACGFEKTTNFYGVRFEKAPNFSACYFKEPKAVNLINVDIDKLDFKSVEQYIKYNYQDESYKNETKGIQDKKEIFKIQNEHQLRYTKNLKDSFRVIKDVLITQNNKLEAQEWHKLELYAKEKELEIQLSKNKNDNLKKESKNQVYNPKDYEKFNYSRLKTLKSKLMPLIFYSLLPMAHTLFLPFYLFCTIFIIIKIITNILIKISKLFYYFYISFRPLEWNKFIIFWKVKFNHCIKKLMTFGRKMLDFTLWFDCILLHVYRNTSDHHTNFLKILNFTILMISSYAIFGLLFLNNMDFILSFGPMTIAAMNYIVLLMLLIIFISLTRQLYQHGAILLFLIYGLFIISIASFLSPIYIPAFYFLIYFVDILIFYLLFICKIKLFVFISRLFAYICLIGVVILKPQLINPFVGIFSSDKLYESKFEKRLNDLNTSAIINLAKLSQKDFNFTKEYINISFTELNSAKALIIANKEKLKEILSKVYDDKYVSDYKKVLNELENNTSNIKNIIEEIDNKNNNSVVSVQLNQFLKLNFSQEIDILYAIKSNFSISEKLSPEQMALFEQKDSQDKLKSVLALLKFKSSFEGILKIINQDEITKNTIKSTSVLYSIILLLCIFSLQKTARKNSIVPS
ncbi:pentapeptide repeat-containing protein [Campylobacter jejuni]|nr:pentapeptide repeat-containing protein [Campylobacter jejuni]EAI9043303.1 pentapeptide repeat-containing protein [Campylobacter jejuni]EAM0391345.1 pentapeptide repeat-containing protein [Campylobacter jejuni]ECK5772389.1 pentapeptide repeat-containing protein [Campylobacter jejuni]EHY5667500.1 pentapeptide repeat-containing protein [Campylobacter jejuni]